MMLAEMMAFNAGFKVVKQFVQNGKDIQGALGNIANMVGAEEALRAKGDRKKNSAWSKLFGNSGSSFEEFQQLESIKEQRKELQSLCRLYAKPGTWDNFIKYEAQVRVQRKKEAQEREKMIARIINWCTWTALFLIVVGGTSGLVYFTLFLKNL